MDTEKLKIISEQLSIPQHRAAAVLKLLDEKASIQFIARYRKEQTGNLDEQQIAAIRDKAEYYDDLKKRKEFIIKKLEDKNLLTSELKEKILNSFSANEIEDIYLPYKETKKTKENIAIEKGLKPFADMFLEGVIYNPYKEALKYIDEAKDLKSAEDVLNSSIDIIAAVINRHSEIREDLRDFFIKEAFIETFLIKKNSSQGQKYRDYFDYREKAVKAPPHRIHAIFRGHAEKILTLKIRPEEDQALNLIIRKIKQYFPGLKKLQQDAYSIVDKAIRQSYSKLILPSLENYLFNELKEKSDSYSISIFAGNLKNILLDSPYGNKPVIGIDPGIRTGSKVVLLDGSGNLIHYTVIYTIEDSASGSDKNKKALDIIKDFIKQYKTEAVVIGNGKGSEAVTEYLKKELINFNIDILTVNESGASVYSASDIARKEFPYLDIVFRGAVSIGRRFQDPLSELIKIDPKSIGVGQYQHDVDQTKLKKALDDVVSNCVNSVGVDLNIAGKELLSYVSGINSTLAENILDYRHKNGFFKVRSDLLKVKGIGSITYQQAAGFLRIMDGENPLDKSAVHPDHYYIVEKIAKDLKVKTRELISSSKLVVKINPEKYIDENIGIITLYDIIKELEKPGRDPRKDFTFLIYTDNINAIEDLVPGMAVNGVVTNITAFGAFVDIGIDQDGLIHKSMISKTFVQNVSDFLQVNQKIVVKIIEVDIERGRVSLSLKDV